jgi:protein TonB
VAAGAEDSSNSIVGYAPSAPRPVHPEDHATDISGTVMLEVSISAQGKVTDARAVSGPPELHAKAVQTVKQWRFKPTLVNGVPTEETTSLGVFLKGN